MAVQVKQILGRVFSTPTAASGVPKGHFAVYVGETKKRFVIPLSYLKNPSFQSLLRQQFLRRSSSQNASATATDIPKGYFAVYIGQDEKKRFIIPISYLSNPLFQDLLLQAEEEYGFEHPMGGITIPCNEDAFIDIISRTSVVRMAIRVPRIANAKRIFGQNFVIPTASNVPKGHFAVYVGETKKRRSSSQNAAATTTDIPKGCFAVYVGEDEKKRFMIPISYLNEPLFQDLLNQAEEEYGFEHPMGGITIPCSEDVFSDTISCLSRI
ncbi:hypothetical protein M9H77_13629 [Catharanthus roseus]|uniref:Uncharacterized protein n=1 Tax=Catharanthus roseus TaxID=4058 RepID=A0ACC0BKP1_CATRO|nr:hypothetical protein M9H77_13629 [Catharanthus roseus]